MGYYHPMKQEKLSAGAIPVRYKDKRWEYLILRSFSYWDFPKGAVEDQEDIWTAASREVKEETTIEDFELPWGEVFIETLPYGKGKVARYYLIQVPQDAVVSLDPNPITGIIEHHAYKWVSYSEARSMLVPRLQEVIDWAEAHITKDNQ